MSGKKAEIKKIMRDNASQAFLLVQKRANAGKLSLVPGRTHVAGTVLDEARHLVIDLLIYAHLFINVKQVNGAPQYQQKRGSDFIDTLRRNVDEAFAQGYKIVVLVLDKQCHTTSAKENTQKNRASSAVKDCAALRCTALAWNIDQPTPIVTRDGIMPPMCAVKATPTAFRYALWEAMCAIIDDYTAPPGCRLIIDMQAYEATNPDTPDEWLNAPGIQVLEQHRAEVEALRQRLKSIAPDKWRDTARRLSTELGRAGMFTSIPTCVHTTLEGVRLEPYPLRQCYNTCGEADLAVWRWVALLFADMSQTALHYAPLVTHAEHTKVTLSPAELLENQRGGRTVVATVDSDFIAGCMAAVGTLICDYVFAQRDPARRNDELIQEVGAYCPIVLLGDTYASTVGYAPHGGVYLKEKDPNALKVFEFIDTCRLFCCLLFNRFPTIKPVIPQVATSSTTTTTTKSKPAAEELEILEPFDVEQSTPHEWFRRALTFVSFCAIAGNDFLKGLSGMSHKPVWSALVKFVKANGDIVMLSNAFLRPHSKTPGVLPSQSAVLVNPSAYTQFIKYCYHTSLVQKGGKNAPKVPAGQLTYEQMAELVKKKCKRSDRDHMPDIARLTLMYERTLWCLYYTLYGQTSVQRTLDETVIGWRADVRTLIV